MTAAHHYEGGRFVGEHGSPAHKAHICVYDFLSAEDEDEQREALFDLRQQGRTDEAATLSVIAAYPLGMLSHVPDAERLRGLLLGVAAGKATVNEAGEVVGLEQPEQSTVGEQSSPALPKLYPFPANDGRLQIDLARKPAPRRYVVPGFVPASITAILAGHGGSCKSLVLLYFGVAVALGRPLFPGMAACEPGAVLIALGEEDAEEAMRRLYAIAEQLGLTAGDLVRLRERMLLYPCLGQDVRLTGHQSGVLKGTGLAHVIAERMRDHAARCGLPAALVGLDHFMLFSGGEVNANEDASAFARETGAITRETGATVLTVAHSPKGDDDKKLTQHSVLGAVSTANLARLVLLAQRMTSKEANRLNIPEGERWRWLHLWTGKTNYTKVGTGIWLKEQETPYETVALAPGAPMREQADQEGAAATTAREALIAFLRAEEAAGVRHTQRTLEKATQRIPGKPKRDEIRDALHWLTERGVVDPAAELPAEKRQGGRQSYLRVTRDLELVERFS